MTTTEMNAGEEISVYVPTNEYDARLLELCGVRTLVGDEVRDLEFGRLVPLKAFFSLSKVWFPRSISRHSIFRIGAPVGTQGVQARADTAMTSLVSARLVDLPVEILQEIYDVKTVMDVESLKQEPGSSGFEFRPFFGCRTDVHKLGREVAVKETIIYLPPRLLSHMVNQMIFEQTAPVACHNAQFALHDAHLGDIRAIINKRQPLLAGVLTEAIRSCVDLVVTLSDWTPLRPVIQSPTQWSQLSDCLVVVDEPIMLTSNKPMYSDLKPYTYTLETVNRVTGHKCSVLLETSNLNMQRVDPFEPDFHAAIHAHVHQTQLVKDFVSFGRACPGATMKLRFVVEWEYCTRPGETPDHSIQVSKVCYLLRFRDIS